jgi:hypothetical protein
MKSDPINDIKLMINAANRSGVSFDTIIMNRRLFNRFINSPQFKEIWHQHFTDRAKMSEKNVNKVLRLHGLKKMIVYEYDRN